MGTEVLRPQDILSQRGRLNLNPSVLPRRKPHYSGNPNPKPHRKPSFTRSEPKKREDVARSVKNDLEQKVTILKRGEAIDFKKKTGDLVLPNPIRVKGEVDALRSEEVYAGSAFFSSPSPRKVPLPTFSKKKGEDWKPFDDSATKDLRRLLRIDCEI